MFWRFGYLDWMPIELSNNLLYIPFCLSSKIQFKLPIYQILTLKGVWTLGGEIWQKNANFGVSFWEIVILFGKTFYTIGLYANVPTKWHILFPSVNSIMAIFRTPKFGVFAILMMQKTKSPARNRTRSNSDVGLQYNHSATVAWLSGCIAVFLSYFFRVSLNSNKNYF